MYISMKKQPARLGEFEAGPRHFGELGQGDTATGVITALGNAINGIVSAITTSKVLMAESSNRKAVAIAVSQENTKKLQIATEGQVQEEQIQVENVQATYSGVTKLILGAGVILAGIIVAGAFAYSLASRARGEFEVEYQVK